MRARFLAPVLAAAALTAGLLVGAPASQAADAPRETVPLPGITAIPDGPIFTGALQDLAALGYREREYVVTITNPTVYSYVGTSTRTRSAQAPRSPQGDYRSRIIVRAPQDPAAFNGRVLVEMMNTTALIDLDIAWQQSHEYLTREGWAYVGITVQQTGLNALRGFTRDSTRYSKLGLNLQVPKAVADSTIGTRDPSLAWDLTSQVGQLMASNGATSPLSGYAVESVYLTGQSQMAGYATTYVNAIHPRHRVFDGFLVAYRGGGATNLQYAAPRAGTVPLTSSSLAQRRLNGRGTPVIALQSWSDPLRAPEPSDRKVFNAALWRPDSSTASDRYRLWEIAGAAHSDRWGTAQALSILRRDTLLPASGTCDWIAPAGINDFPARFAWNAALESLAAWAEAGTAPATGQRLQRGRAGAVSVDSLGNPLGGLRLPRIEVPVARYTPTSGAGTGLLALFCPLTGGQQPLSESDLAARYPTTESYVTKVSQASDAAVAAGILLAEDARMLVEMARRGPVKDAETIRDY